MSVVNKTVGEVMTRVVFVVAPEHTVGVATAAMREGDVRHLAVVNEQGALLGMLSDRDIAGTSLAAPVAEVMSGQPVTIASSAPAYEAVALMLQHRFNAVPVVDAEGTLAGIITTTDVMILAYEALASSAEQTDARPVDVDRSLLAAKVLRVREATHAAALATAIAELSSFLKQRFRHEEDHDGIFAQIVEEQPERSRDMAEMCAEHAELIATAHRLIDDNWERARSDRGTIAPGAPDFVRAVEEHEEHEAAIIARSLAARS